LSLFSSERFFQFYLVNVILHLVRWYWH